MNKPPPWVEPERAGTMLDGVSGRHTEQRGDLPDGAFHPGRGHFPEEPLPFRGSGCGRGSAGADAGALGLPAGGPPGGLTRSTPVPPLPAVSLAHAPHAPPHPRQGRRGRHFRMRPTEREPGIESHPSIAERLGNPATRMTAISRTMSTTRVHAIACSCPVEAEHAK